MHTLRVELGARSYPIYIGSGLLAQDALFLSHIKGKQICIITNDTVAPLYLEQIRAHFVEHKCSVVVLPDGEQYKTIEVWSRVFDVLLSERHNRTTTLIALGGGVIGDMAGFAAACYQRGVDFIQVPTTLLSQVDSSVGGKTGVNHPLGKNMIGAFYQPRAVIADMSTLATLPSREFAAGLAEVIKYGLIVDADFFVWLEGNIDGLVARNPELMAYAVRRSCECKASVVGADETEQGMRAILNLGHTFGHAIETEQGYGSWLHGEAVAVGMVMAVDLSVALGWLESDVLGRARRLLVRAGLPVSGPSSMTSDVFLRHMAVDKKVLDGSLRLVLLEALGRAVVSSSFPVHKVAEVIARNLETSGKVGC